MKRMAVLVTAAVALLAGCEREPAGPVVVPPRPPTGLVQAPQVEPALPPEVASPAPQPAVEPPAAAAAGTGQAAGATARPGDTDGARMLAARTLVVPVAGVAPTALSDDYELARGSRVHEAIDIMAPAGTPVVAVDDGRIAKLFTSKAGGLTIYHFDAQGQLAYYYAHLQAYAPGLREGATVRRGEVIGSVGSTGNADPKAPHLHFAVFRLGPQRNWWQGDAVNPYPALRKAAPSP